MHTLRNTKEAKQPTEHKFMDGQIIVIAHGLQVTQEVWETAREEGSMECRIQVETSLGKQKEIGRLVSVDLMEKRVSEWPLAWTNHTLSRGEKPLGTKAESSIFVVKPPVCMSCVQPSHHVEAHSQTSRDKSPCSLVPRIPNLNITSDLSINACFAVPNVGACEHVLLKASQHNGLKTKSTFLCQPQCLTHSMLS